jgi:RNA polymerase sigma factor for flagellar operon FliA
MGPATRLVEATDSKALRARISQAYAEHARRAEDEKRILEHLPLVRHVVQRVLGHLGPGGDTEDLISAGTLGLVKAARSFDPDRDASFKTYAYIRIRGAVLDELRGRSFAPASARARVRQVEQAYRRHAGGHGRPPTDEELARAVGVSRRELYGILEEARRQHFLSIHGLGPDGPALADLLPADRSPGPAEQAERKELIERLSCALRELPKRDRLVLLLYYERDLTMKEVAAVLDITESRVSQLHAAALFKLAMRLRTKP